MSQKAVSDEFNQLKSDLVNKIYPVGSIYMSLDPTSPIDLFGGNWSRIKDVFLLTAGDTYSVTTNDKDGGSVTVTLDINQMPNHNHIGVYTYGNHDWQLMQKNSLGIQTSISYGLTLNSDAYWTTLYNTTGGLFDTGTTGGNQPHNNMPPYKVVYAWQRLADNIA